MIDNKIKVSVVSYTNSLPFVYGLEKYTGEKNFELQKDIPAVCAQKLLTNQVDVGLVPVAILPELKEYYIVSDYCIGAEAEVASVVLYSDVPLAEIKTVLLDFQSRTSVQLVQVLASNYWKINPKWKKAEINFIDEIKETTAAVVIGDRTFSLKNKYKYTYDLAGEWKKHTGLPFVFAAWIANKKLHENFLSNFSKAIAFGIENKALVIEELKTQHIPNFDAALYLNHNISFELTPAKREGMELFLSLLKKGQRVSLIE